MGMRVMAFVFVAGLMFHPISTQIPQTNVSCKVTIPNGVMAGSPLREAQTYGIGCSRFMGCGPPARLSSDQVEVVSSPERAHLG
jgi:hypothetical protein